MRELHHAVRNSILDKETSFTLYDDALAWTSEAGSGRLAYTDIKMINLISYPNGGTEVCQTKIVPHSGKRVLLRSHHLVQLGTFEDRRETYGPFVRELLARASAQSPDARITSGSTGLWIAWGVVGFIMLLLVIMMVVILMDATPVGGSMWIAVVLLLIAGPLTFRQLMKGRSRTFDPANPPPELLGERGN